MPNIPTPAPKLENIQALQAALSDRAQQLGLEVTRDPAALARVELPALLLLAKPPAETPQAAPVPSMFIGPWTVLFANLGGSAKLPPPSESRERDEVIGRWRTCQHHAAIVRSSLEKSRQDDLLVFLIGPDGGDQDKEWCALASQIERDDLVCRKLVWMPPASPAERPNSLARFVGRTFLARPWEQAGASPQTSLDKISDVGETLTAWQIVLDEQPHNEEEIDYDELARKLIATHQP